MKKIVFGLLLISYSLFALSVTSHGDVKLYKCNPIDRKSLNSSHKGLMFFDTTLNKPVWYMGGTNNWVDVSGEKIEVDVTAPGFNSFNQTFTTSVGTSLILQKVTASDDIDKNITVSETGSVDFDTVGTYNITYTATDRSGNSSSIVHTYIVEGGNFTGWDFENSNNDARLSSDNNSIIYNGNNHYSIVRTKNTTDIDTWYEVTLSLDIEEGKVSVWFGNTESENFSTSGTHTFNILSSTKSEISLVGKNFKGTVNDISFVEIHNSGLIKNGTFTKNFQNWSVNFAKLSIESGKLKISNSTDSTARAVQPIDFRAGETYRITGYQEGQGSMIQIKLSDNSTVMYSEKGVDGNISKEFTSNISGKGEIWLRVDNRDAETGYFDNISLEIISNNINVKDYGAIGDGKNDDTKAIEEANKFAEKNGGTLYFPNGTYSITNLNFYNNVSYLGENRENTIIKKTSDNDYLTLRYGGNIENISVNGLTFDANNNDAKMLIQLAGTVNNFSFSGNKIINATNIDNEALRVAFQSVSNNVMIDDNIVDSSYNGVFRILTDVKGNNNISISNNIITQSGGTVIGIYTDTNHPDGDWGAHYNVKVNNNRITNLTDTGNHGAIPIEVWGVTNYEATYNYIDSGTRGMTATFGIINAIISNANSKNKCNFT